MDIRLQAHLPVSLLYIVSLFLATLSPLGFLRTATADFFIHSWEDHYTNSFDLRLESIYYYSATNFSSSGTPYYPTSLQYYARLQGDLILRQALLERFSFFGRVGWSYVNLLGTLRSGNGYGLADQSVGFTARLYEGGDFTFASTSGSIDFQVQLDFPAYNNATSDTAQTPSLGDGTLDGTAGLFFNLPLWSDAHNLVKIVAGAGYTYRNNGFSAAIPWSFDFKYVRRKGGLFFDLLSSGFFSLNTDAFGTFLGRSSVGTSGSTITGASNASLIIVGGRLGYRTGNHFEIYAGGSQALWGQGAPNGYTFSGGLALHTGVSKERDLDPAHTLPENFGQSNQGFVSYSLDAKVLKAIDRLNLVKIDKGSQDGVEVGQVFDIFEVGKTGAAQNAVARAQVTSVKHEESVLTIQEYYKQVWIDEGFVLKRLVH